MLPPLQRSDSDESHLADNVFGIEEAAAVASDDKPRSRTAFAEDSVKNNAVRVLLSFACFDSVSPDFKDL
jgi:hypothetical protein